MHTPMPASGPILSRPARWTPSRRHRSGKLTRLVLLAALGLAPITACRRGTVAPSSGAPTLTALSPSRADISNGEIVTIEVRGSGFAPFNTIMIGDVVLRQIARVSPTRLRFTVPLDDAQRLDRGGTPVVPLRSGAYDVRVVPDGGGPSNTLVLTIVNSRAP